jgi:hypothetical protein
MLEIGSQHCQQGKCNNINTCIKQEMGKEPTSERGNSKKISQNNINKKNEQGVERTTTTNRMQVSRRIFCNCK